MLDEGYAAATSRRVAAKACVKPALVHYYFPSMEDLFVAVLRDKAEVNLARQREAIAEARPLHALWQLNSAHDAQLFTEFLAMANHRKAIRSEIVSYAMRFRDLEEGVVTLALKARGVDLELFPPVVMSMIMGGLARILLMKRDSASAADTTRLRLSSSAASTASKCRPGISPTCERSTCRCCVLPSAFGYRWSSCWWWPSRCSWWTASADSSATPCSPSRA